MGKQRNEYLWYHRTCENASCRKVFRTSKPFARYCSDACKQAAYRERKSAK